MVAIVNPHIKSTIFVCAIIKLNVIFCFTFVILKELMHNERTLVVITTIEIQINDILIVSLGNSLGHEVYQGLTAEQ